MRKILNCFSTFSTCTTSATPKEEKSNIVYIDITNEPADDRETIFKVLSSLESQYREIRGISEFLPVVGDAKTYNHLVELKRSYGQELSWLLPLPGDWHILKNFQPVL